jgi:WD40 repeat protein
VRQFNGHTAGVRAASFSSDGKHVVTASADGTARLWDADYHTTMQSLCPVLQRDLTQALLQHNKACSHKSSDFGIRTAQAANPGFSSYWLTFSEWGSLIIYCNKSWN